MSTLIVLCGASFVGVSIAGEDSVDLTDAQLRLFSTREQVCGPIAVCAALSAIELPRAYGEVRSLMAVTEIGSSLQECRKCLEKSGASVVAVETTVENILAFLETDKTAAILREDPSHWVCICKGMNGAFLQFRYPAWSEWNGVAGDDSVAFALLISNTQSGARRTWLGGRWIEGVLITTFGALSLVNLGLLRKK